MLIEGISTLQATHLPWREWLAIHFASYITAPFADRHIRYWEWLSSLEPGVKPRATVEVWGRGGGKSATVELGCAYMGSFAQPPRRFVLYVSETQAQADKHVQAIANMLLIAGMQPAKNRLGAPQGWRREQVRTSNGFNVAAFGLDSGMRGARLDEFRPDLIVFDDVDGRHDTSNTVEKKIDIITETILPSGSVDCAVTFVQNKIHQNSIVSQLADGRAGFLHGRVPAAVESAVVGLEYRLSSLDDGTPYFRITNGEATWEGQDIETCERQLNEWGPPAFLREAQHEVERTEGGTLHRLWFQESPQIIRPVTALIQAWDTAFKTGDDNDRSAAVTIAVTPDNYPVVDVWYDRLEFPDLVRAVQQRAAHVQHMYPLAPLSVLVEDKASGQSLIQTLQRSTQLNVIPVAASRPNEKVQRVNEIAPVVESLQVSLPSYAPWRDTFIDEVTSFPFARHDDITDAFAIALRRAARIGQDAPSTFTVTPYFQGNPKHGDLEARRQRDIARNQRT